MGLNKVFVSPTQDEGDILFTAASILGEKRQLTSKLVSIDVQQIALRGNPPKNKFEIYYTVDGTEPSRNSIIYKDAFSVELGTTVKSSVYISGDHEPTFVMEEKFDADE
jgi:beta-galactosidase